MNVIDATVIEELSAIVEQLATDGAVKGVVITSGKDTFCAGADLTMLETLSRTFAELAQVAGRGGGEHAAVRGKPQAVAAYRRIETCGKPWVAAINGTAVGGGFELALACHHRVAAENDKTRLGLPEIKVGLFPGRRRHAAHRAHAAAGRRAAIPAQGRPASRSIAPRR